MRRSMRRRIFLSEQRRETRSRKSKIENRKSKIENRKSKIENRKSKIENRKSTPLKAQPGSRNHSSERTIEEICRAVLRNGVECVPILAPTQAGDSLGPAFIDNRAPLQIGDEDAASGGAFQP